MLNVFTNRQHAGSLGRKNAQACFTYGNEIDDSRIISMSMPPTPNGEFKINSEYFIHPAFAMNLPEGRLREGIERMFRKTVPAMDDMTLLEIVGRSQIGRIRAAPSMEELDRVPEISLDSVLKATDSENLFNELIERYARYSGVAGSQPKILAKDKNPVSPT